MLFLWGIFCLCFFFLYIWVGICCWKLSWLMCVYGDFLERWFKFYLDFFVCLFLYSLGKCFLIVRGIDVFSLFFFWNLFLVVVLIVVFLDYYDIVYKVVEVNFMGKKEIKWLEYKKVFILVVDGEVFNDFIGIFYINGCVFFLEFELYYIIDIWFCFVLMFSEVLKFFWGVSSVLELLLVYVCSFLYIII